MRRFTRRRSTHNSITGVGEKNQSEGYVASEICKSKRNNKSCSSLQICSAEHAATLQDKIVPLKGKPYFSTIIGQNSVYTRFMLRVPSTFLPFFPQSSSQIVLCCREKEWLVQCTMNEKSAWLKVGWRDFAIDNNLRLGDGCIFELLDDDKMKFKVQILRGEVPTDSRVSGVVGEDADHPIVVD